MKKENLEKLLQYIIKVNDKSVAALADAEREELLQLATYTTDTDANYYIYDDCYISLYTDEIIETVDDEIYKYTILDNDENNKFRCYRNNEECSIDSIISDILDIIENGIYVLEYTETECDNRICVSTEKDDIIEYIENNISSDELDEYGIYLYDDSTYDYCLEHYNIEYDSDINEFEII